MGLAKYKTFEDARKKDLEDIIKNSVSASRSQQKEKTSSAAKPFEASHYPKGIYRFKSWEEARNSDLEHMIRHSIRRKSA
ncbi:MAG: hypothetical protein ABH871_01875 [Pseudomonadota bacterium]|nr:hypothetical protein [Patescibacteria group bacterium]